MAPMVSLERLARSGPPPAGPRRLDPEQLRFVAAHHAAPELLLSGQKQMLEQRIGVDGEFDPLPCSRDDRQHGGPGIGDPHIVLQLRHVLSAAPS
jgi:hypothetical protein